MLVCPQCGYEKNLDNALFCNLCHKILRKEERQTSSSITSFADLPEDIKNLLLQQKREIENKEKEALNISFKKGCLLFTIIGMGIFALMLLRFFFIIPTK